MFLATVVVPTRRREVARVSFTASAGGVVVVVIAIFGVMVSAAVSVSASCVCIGTYRGGCAIVAIVAWQAVCFRVGRLVVPDNEATHLSEVWERMTKMATDVVGAW